MKTEAEIRRHRDDLRMAQQTTCTCQGHGHTYECLVGGEMMQAVETTLSWILDEEPSMDQLVARTAAAARQVRSEAN